MWEINLSNVRPCLFSLEDQLSGHLAIPCGGSVLLYRYTRIAIVFPLFRIHWLCFAYFLVFCIGHCVPVHKDRTPHGLLLNTGLTVWDLVGATLVVSCLELK